MNILKQHGTPTPNTYASVGDLYIDLDSNIIYKLTQVDNPGVDLGFVNVYKHTDTMYIWEVESMGTGGADLVLKVHNDDLSILSGSYEKVVNKFREGDMPDVRIVGVTVTDYPADERYPQYTSYECIYESVNSVSFNDYQDYIVVIMDSNDGTLRHFDVYSDGSVKEHEFD